MKSSKIGGDGKKDATTTADEDYLLHPIKYQAILPTLNSLRPTFSFQSLPTSISLFKSLTFLELGSTPNLVSLPTELSQCVHIRILFINGCRNMHVVPPVLGEMPSLTRLGLKSNGLRTISGASLPPHVEHLILTDNQISFIDRPAFVKLGGSCRKLMLSHNKLTSFGKESEANVALLQHLELVRLSNNKLECLPISLWLLPKLAWVAISGNPKLLTVPSSSSCSSIVPTVDFSDIDVDNGKVLGVGASGNVVHGTWKEKDVAIKLFHNVTSDGRGVDEVDIQRHVGGVGRCNPHLVAAIGVCQFRDSGKGKNTEETKVDGIEVGETKVGVMMDILPMGLTDLALPPTIEEVIEDRYGLSEEFSLPFILSILCGVAGALHYLHAERKVSHGDVYAHNIVVDRSGGSNCEESSVRLLDLGAAFYYGGKGERKEKRTVMEMLCERVEVRAFGVLAKELMERSSEESERDEKIKRKEIGVMVASCLNVNVRARPTFGEILTTCTALN